MLYSGALVKFLKLPSTQLYVAVNWCFSIRYCIKILTNNVHIMVQALPEHTGRLILTLMCSSYVCPIANIKQDTRRGAI